jgi:hypothetical protein
MIKHTFLVLLLLSILLFNTTHAHNKVAVVPLLGGDTFQLTTETAELFSWHGILASNQSETVLTVPAGKIFVLTQIYGFTTSFRYLDLF